jgi:hypothetical protein
MKPAIAPKAISLIIGALWAGAPACAAELEWNYNGQAIAIGQNTPPPPPGCDSSTGDTSIVVVGNEVGVVFTNMHLQLDAATPALSGRKNCHIVIPTQIAKGWYIASLRQKLTWAMQKTQGSTGQVESRARFSFLPLNSIRITKGPLEQGIFNESTDAIPNIILVTNPSFGWCLFDRSFEANMVVDVSTNALRTDPNQVISTFIDGFDARWDAIVGLQKCNI